MSEEAICICEKHDFYDFFPNNEKTKCPCCEVERLTAELAEVMEEAKVWQDRYRKRGYVMDEHAKALERAEIAEAELARYKQGVEVEDFVNRYGVLEAEFELRPDLWGKRVRVLVMKEEE